MANQFIFPKFLLFKRIFENLWKLGNEEKRLSSRNYWIVTECSTGRCNNPEEEHIIDLSWSYSTISTYDEKQRKVNQNEDALLVVNNT